MGDSLKSFLEKKGGYEKIACRDCNGDIDRNHIVYYRLLDDIESLFIVVHWWKGVSIDSFFAAEVRFCNDPEDLIYASYGDCDSVMDLGDGFKTLDELKAVIDRAIKSFSEGDGGAEAVGR